jgi:phosphoribosylformylglycinamidine synthase subunit PurQ / glutaminase
MQVSVLVLRAAGINRDEDAALACELAGARAERVHINRLAEGRLHFADYGMVVVPGGFSYGDHLGAGKLLAVDLMQRLGEELRAFVDSGRPVIGICNGFQALVRAGVLPGWDENPARITLTDNASRRFECRWVHLAVEPASPCIFTQGIEQAIEVPVAHGEGRFVAADDAVLEQLSRRGQIALRYAGAQPEAYPANPNGSAAGIAGICNARGNVLGLMPHPENAVFPYQHPRWTREPLRETGDGLALFRNAVRYAA